MISKADLVRLYLEDHRTQAQIGEMYGVSRSHVSGLMGRYRIPVHGGRLEVTCDVCKRVYSITRKRYLSSVSHFCGIACYGAYRRSGRYRQWRHGQRIARGIVEKRLGIDLGIRVVHHIDGDDMNNEFENLRVFEDNASHIAHHHELKRGWLKGLYK